MIPLHRLLLALACLTSSTALAAQPAGGSSADERTAPGIRGDFSGSWFDPARSGQGFSIEVLEGGRAVIGWFTFDTNGAPYWLAGDGTVAGTELRVDLFKVSGGRFPSGPADHPVTSVRWGELVLAFSGCDTGEARWEPSVAGFIAGSMPIQRLTGIDGTRCNGAEEFTEQRTFGFERGTAAFTTMFADHPAGDEARMGLESGRRALPAPLDGRHGIRLAGTNHSDDLAMIVKTPLRGLAANGLYEIEMDMEMASNTPSGCFGIGGSPGDDVRMFLGSSAAEPQTRVDPADGWVRATIALPDGETGTSADAVRVGALANRFECGDAAPTEWQLKTLSTRGRRLRARADATGVLWLFAGSDSGFEGRSEWYLLSMTVRLQEIDAGDPTPQ